MDDTMSHVAKLLATHDWYYSYSDDHGVWRRGEASWQLLLAACRRIPAVELRPLWMAHAPAEYQEMFDRIFGD